MAFHSDHALWLAFKRGDREALDHLFRTYYPMLYHYGIKIYAGQEMIEESLQDFFLYLYDHRENLSTPQSIKSYLFKAYRRHLLRKLKKIRNEQARHEEHVLWQPDIHFSSDEIIIRSESEALRKQILQDMLQRLPRRQREAIFLRYYNNLSVKEVAEVLSISYQGAVNTLYKAIKALRKDTNLPLIKALFSLLLLSAYPFL